MKNQKEIAMYVGLGMAIAIVLLFLTGRLRENYKASTEDELMQFLDEVEKEDNPDEDDKAPAAMGEDSDSEEDDE